MTVAIREWMPEPLNQPRTDELAADRRASTAPSPGMLGLLARLDSFACLAPGWAGDDTIPPTPAAIANARHVLNAMPSGIDGPQPTASGTGEVCLTWFNGPGRLDAILSPDGFLIWASADRESVAAGEALDLSAASLDTFIKALIAFHE